MIKVETARAATHWSPSKSSILNCNKSFTFLAVGTVSICSVRTPKRPRAPYGKHIFTGFLKIEFLSKLDFFLDYLG